MGKHVDITRAVHKYVEGEKLREKGWKTGNDVDVFQGNIFLAEGVKEFQKHGETQEILFDRVDKIRKCGCFEKQGYYCKDCGKVTMWSEKD